MEKSASVILSLAAGWPVGVEVDGCFDMIWQRVRERERVLREVCYLGGGWSKMKLGKGIVTSC